MELNLDQADLVLGRFDGSRAVAIQRYGGASADVFAVSRDREPRLVLKVYAPESAWKAQKEALVAELLRGRSDAALPQWLLHDLSGETLGRPFALISMLPGESMRARIGAPEAQGLYLAMGHLLRRLHDIAMPAYGIFGRSGVIEDYTTNRALMAPRFEVKFADFSTCSGPPALLSRIERRAAELDHALDGCVGPAFCHNDFHPGNVLAARQDGVWRLSGLIDFENALAGDPLFDLAKALDYTAHEDPSGRAPLLEGYGPMSRQNADDAIELYRIYHKLELWNFFRANARADEACAALLRDLEAMSEA